MLTDCSRALKRRATEKLFQSVEYNCLVLRYNKISEKRLVRKEVRIDDYFRKLLKMSREHGGIGFSWWKDCEDLTLILNCESMQISGSASIPNQMVPMEAVVNGMVPYEEADSEEERLCLIQNSIPVDDFFTLLHLQAI